MKIKDLKKLLEQYPEELEAILSKDEEGNQFSPLFSVQEFKYVPKNEFYGDIADLDEETGKMSLPALVFYPSI
jgi:hypothetical protein